MERAKERGRFGTKQRASAMFLKGRKEGTIIVGGGTEKWFAMEPLAVAVSDKPPDFWWLLKSAETKMSPNDNTVVA